MLYYAVCKPSWSLHRPVAISKVYYRDTSKLMGNLDVQRGEQKHIVGLLDDVYPPWIAPENFCSFKVKFTFYHGKSPLKHHVGNTVLIFFIHLKHI